METIKKSRGYFPNTKQGQKDYEKQWDDSEFEPTAISCAGMPFLK